MTRQDVLACTQPDPKIGDYVQVQHILAEGELASPTLPFRAAVAGFFADAPDTTL
jgi:hypothetical protein